MRHIEVTGCQYINRKQFEYQDLKERGCPVGQLDFAKVDDPVFLGRILRNSTKVRTLVYSGDISKLLLDTLHAFCDRIRTLVALDMSVFSFEQIQEQLQDTSVELCLQSRSNEAIEQTKKGTKLVSTSFSNHSSHLDRHNTKETHPQALDTRRPARTA